MIRKTLITALLFVFVLSACRSNAEPIQPTSTSIPTLLPATATYTFTPKPTATPTPLPTATPFRYTSCVDPELMASLEEAFVAEVGQSIADYVANLVANGKYETGVGSSHDTGIFNSDEMYVGRAQVSLEHLPGAQEGDRAFCGMFVSNADPSIMEPIVFGYVYKGVFYKTAFTYDARNGAGNDAVYFNFQSESDLDTWFEGANGPKPGDVFFMAFQTFDNARTLEEVAEMDPSTTIPTRDNVLALLRLLDNGFLERTGGSPTLAAAYKLSAEQGDIGLFVQSIDWKGPSK